MSNKIVTDKKRIEEIFDRGIVEEILPSREDFIKELASGRKLRIYIGADPTSDTLHLSHAKNYMFLEELRQLGHEVIILVGDFTARIGDPTDKESTRKQLNKEDVEKNVKNWIEQIKPLVDFEDKQNPPQIKHNSEWLADLSLEDIISLSSNFTVQQMIERDMFEKRIQDNKPIYLHEFLYPLMQGYDSVAMDVDVELCGTDQTFNALAGRTLLKRIKDKEKFIIAVNLMENPKTGELMSKSAGTGVFLNTSPSEMYGALMALPDEMTEVLFINCTRIPLSEKDEVMQKGPRDAKAHVAFEIVKKFHGADGAKEAEEDFNRTFREGGLPDDMQQVELSQGDDLARKLVDAGIVSSKSDWQRLVKEGAVKINGGESITDAFFTPEETLILKIGKRRVVKVVVK